MRRVACIGRVKNQKMERQSARVAKECGSIRSPLNRSVAVKFSSLVSSLVYFESNESIFNEKENLQNASSASKLPAAMKRVTVLQHLADTVLNRF